MPKGVHYLPAFGVGTVVVMGVVVMLLLNVGVSSAETAGTGSGVATTHTKSSDNVQNHATSHELYLRAIHEPNPVKKIELIVLGDQVSNTTMSK